MTSKTKPTDPYAKAGVNIETGNELVESIKARVQRMIAEFWEGLEVLLDFSSLDLNIKILF